MPFPAHKGAALPSLEILSYLGNAFPKKTEWLWQEVQCYRIQHPLKVLREIQFSSLYHSSILLGSDLRFWIQFARELSQLFRRQHFIPALKAIAPTPSGKTTGKKQRAKAPLAFYAAQFQLRGLSLEKLRDELEQSPLGQALLFQMGEATNITVTQVSTFFIQPQKEEALAEFSPETFWSGRPLPKKLLTLAASSEERAVLLLKKQGDYPAFWNKPSSFFEVMDELYRYIARKT
jgi:hypothetical protein